MVCYGCYGVPVACRKSGDHIDALRCFERRWYQEEGLGVLSSLAPDERPRPLGGLVLESDAKHVAPRRKVLFLRDLFVESCAVTHEFDAAADEEASTGTDSGDEASLKALLQKERQLSKQKDAQIQKLEARVKDLEADLEKAQLKVAVKERQDGEVARAQQELLDELKKRKAVQYELISSSQQLLELRDKVYQQAVCKAITSKLFNPLCCQDVSNTWKEGVAWPDQGSARETAMKRPLVKGSSVLSGDDVLGGPVTMDIDGLCALKCTISGDAALVPPVSFAIGSSHLISTLLICLLTYVFLLISFLTVPDTDGGSYLTYCAKLQQLSGQSTVAWHDNLVRPICGVGFRIQTGPVSPVTDNFYSFCDWTDIQLLDQQTPNTLRSLCGLGSRFYLSGQTGGVQLEITEQGVDGLTACSDIFFSWAILDQRIPITLRSHCGLGSRFYLTGQTGGVQLDTTVQGVDGLTDCSDIIFSWEFLDQQLPITLRSHCGLGSRLYLTGQTGGVPLATIVQGEEGLLDCPDITLLSANTSIQGLDPCRLAGDIQFFFSEGVSFPNCFSLALQRSPVLIAERRQTTLLADKTVDYLLAPIRFFCAGVCTFIQILGVGFPENFSLALAEERLISSVIDLADIANLCFNFGGCISSMGDAETSNRWNLLMNTIPDVKPHGPRPPLCGTAPDALCPKKASPVVKRSLHRAQKRAFSHGMTWYKGRCLTPNDFIKMGMAPLSHAGTVGKPKDIRTCHSSNKPKRRLTCFHWNGGGLASHTLDEIKNWLSLQQIDIAVLTETRWSFQSSWSDHTWHHVHSADTEHRGSGVLILISKSLCSDRDIRWNEIIPGRILHIRLMHGLRNIDILGCYQHVFRKDPDQLKRREQFWSKLEKQLSLLPSRNTVAVLGDFNCSLQASGGICGTGQYQWNQSLQSGACHSDSNRFMQVLRAGGLVALNTWDHKLGPTYIHQHSSSRIDYACTRSQFADGQAKDVHYLWTAPFLSPGHQGHVPIVCTLARYWIPPQHSRFGLTPNQKERGRLAKLAAGPDWHTFLTATAEPVWHQFQSVLTSGFSELHAIHETAIEHFAQAFPAISTVTKPEPWQNNPYVLNKWQHRRLATTLTTHGLHSFFRGWFHIAPFQCLKRAHRRHAALLRRQKFEEILQLANTAAMQHDTRKLFDIIHRFSPKVPRRKMQLRNELGTLMTISEERSELTRFVEKTWAGTPMPATVSAAPPGVPFTLSALTAAIRRIPTGKALIPKPNQPPTRPEQLRPLALQCPLGKAVFGLLIQVAAEQVDVEFRKNRSPKLLHTAERCATYYKPKNPPRILELPMNPNTLAASVAISVNTGLRQGCKGAPFLWNCLTILLLHELQGKVTACWIREHLTAYADDLHIGGTFQSCMELQTLIESIGVLFSLLEEFDLKLNPQKSVAILAMTGSMSRKTRAKHILCDKRGELLRIPVDDKVTLVPIKKTTVYLGCIMGYQHFENLTTWHRVRLAQIGFARMRKWLCNRFFSRQRRLRLWQTCIMPVMTYGVFAVGITPKGCKHMLVQLGKMLRSIAGDHAFHTGNTNAQVFHSSALPNPADLLIAAVDTLQRSITQRIPTLQEDDCAKLLNWDLLPTYAPMILMAQADHANRCAETALSGVVTGDNSLYQCALCNFRTDHLPAFRSHCTTSHAQRMYRTHDLPLHTHATDGLPTCKFCHQFFHSWRSFRHHMERGCQAIIQGPPDCTGTPYKMAMSTGTLPTRPMAQTPGPVTLTDADLALLRSMPWCASVLHCIATNTMHNLEHVREACQYLSSRCFICGLQLPRTQDLHHHFRTEHPAYWDRVPTKAMILSNIHSSESPCPHCGGIFKKHQCPFWTQISIMSLYGGSLVQPTEPVEAIPEYRCDICLELHPDAAQLARRLQTKHKLAGMTFNVSRDSLDAQAACAHCGSTHASMEGLRSHITQGRCPCFNPAAEAETTPVSQDWLDICLHGKMLEFLQSPMTRLHWTIRCQQCPKVYARAGDLANHLMNSHSRLWRQAQGLTLILVDLLFARRGCTCNPQIHQQRQNHICVPLRQIAMIYYRLHQEPFMPIQLPDTVLEHLVHPSFSADVQARLRGIFTNRTFTDLWTAQDVLQILSNACTICGQDQHPGELCRHLHEAHVCGHRFVDFYTDTLLQTVTMTFQQDHQCVLCQQVFNLPASSDSHETAAQRQRLVQAHLKGNCPGDLALTGWDETAFGQIREPFQFLAPIFDKSLKLPPNPKPAKHRRTEGQGQQVKDDPDQPEPRPHTHLMQYLQILGQLALRHEQSLSLMQSTDSFILFFQQEQGGALQGLLQETQKWNQQRQTSTGTTQTPLRQHLCQWLLTDLLNKATKVSEAQKGDQILQACLEKRLLLEDLSWPYLRWDPVQTALVIDKKKSVSMKKMLQHLEELIQDFRDPTLVLKFQGLQTSSSQSTIPWKLQLNLRTDRPYELLLELTHSAIWMLVGSSLKPHNAKPSNLANQLRHLMPKGKGEGKGKTRSKGKAKNTA
ncbi:unnamed protein product [Cladocopium goreaui]|uniref:LINE-1 retrotransposable element ORF2 protein n=1 Tax=Cladocopium goreaui TaxID=2562237 RepID=A0A9P1D790_9DINO|nr:unnamed protein product [Cladocopium goreaui]